MTTTDTTATTRPTYRVPEWAKRELGAAKARKYARELLAAAKQGGSTFEQACSFVDEMLAEAADFEFEQRIEREASLRFHFPDSYR